MQLLIDILNNRKKKVAILVDPDKMNGDKDLIPLVEKINILDPAFIFIGGSTVDIEDFNLSIATLKKMTQIPLVIFPGSHQQISPLADGILFLSLISGRNPDYLIGHQIESAHLLKKMDIEVISTGYMLIDGGSMSAVSYVSQTNPIPANQTSIAVNTAIAGETLGFKTLFMDAGSGAENPIDAEMISAVKKHTDLPLIIGGGIKTIQQLESALNAGADLVVIGNKIEDDIDFLLDIKSVLKNVKANGIN